MPYTVIGTFLTPTQSLRLLFIRGKHEGVNFEENKVNNVEQIYKYKNQDQLSVYGN